MKDNRPVNLEIGTINFPITAIISILHRISGVAIFGGVAVLLWWLDASLASPEGFATVKQCLAHPLAKLVLWLICVGLIYHTCAGVRHLIMDMGIGETLAGGVLGARLVVAISIVFSVIAGVWLW